MPSQLPLRESELLLLSMLLKKPAHAYLLAKRLPFSSQSSTYRTILRLKRAGYLSEKTEAGVKNPDKKVLRLTEAGRAAYTNSSDDWITRNLARLRVIGQDYRRLAWALRSSGRFS